MNAIELPLRDIFEAAACRPEQLDRVEEELTPEEVERITDAGQWGSYREEDQWKTLLPSLGEERYYSGRVPFYADESDSRGGPREPVTPPGVVVPIRGRAYRVTLRVADIGDDTDHAARGKTLVLTPTDDEPTLPDIGPGAAGRPARRSRAHLRFFGQPAWVQNEHFPADLRGEPCSHLVTVENGWGDAGNWNVLVGFDETGVPNVAYFEASCC